MSINVSIREEKKPLKCIKISISSRCETDEIVRYALLFPFTVGVGLNISPSLVGEKNIKAFFFLSGRNVAVNPTSVET